MKLKDLLDIVTKGKKITVAKKVGALDVMVHYGGFDNLPVREIKVVKGKIIIYPEKRYFPQG